MRKRTPTELLRQTAEVEADAERTRADSVRTLVTVKRVDVRAEALKLASASQGLVERADTLRMIAQRILECGKTAEANSTFAIAKAIKMNALKTKAEALDLADETSRKAGI